ncbi:MAG: aspartate-semialdehyde dehydrogenase [Clostridiales bacterium GWF2_38_85]|nr:MAG: aspartate-semialdehyde dehydrogenase [Clostridiales bacterium GWF2_38_85]HBL85395.1 aspartate-semialdehyde dehydrogenase [Clostridiales bacterium]
MKKIRAGVVGATGMVGQRFILLLQNHPYFELSFLAASSRSAGKPYAEAIEGRWKLTTEIPEAVKAMMVYDAADLETVKANCDFVFCAVDMKKYEIKKLEETYAKAEIPVVSNNSANRWTSDVPMVIPEINPQHLAIIDSQKKRLGTKKGFIAVKPNCSIQSYVPALQVLLKFGVKEVAVCTYQAISGAGKTFKEFPEMIDNVIPYIGGEEEKSEKEPLKIWGEIKDGEIKAATTPVITAQCIRVPVSDGHLAAVFVKFVDKKPSMDEIKACWVDFKGVDLPSAPKQFIHYFEEDNRPQTKLDRELEGGMAISVGRLREDNLFDCKFIGLSHNTLRGAAGGAVLIAELLYKEGYLY